MEHATIKKINDKFYRVTPDEGYILRSKTMPYNQYSDATTDDPERDFEVIPIQQEEPEPTDTAEA